MTERLEIARFVRQNMDRGYSVETLTMKKSPSEQKDGEVILPDD